MTGRGFDFRGPAFELSATHNEVNSNKGSDFSKAYVTSRPGYYRIDHGVLTPKSGNVRVSPVSLQLLLNQDQDRRQRLLELKSMEAQSRHEREVRYFADHIRRQSEKNQDLNASEEPKSNFRR